MWAYIYMQMTFALTVKQLMSLDPCEWIERLRKEYILVIEGFLTIPSPLFSTTYRRAVQVLLLEHYLSFRTHAYARGM